MRKLAAVGTLVLALSLGAVSAVGAAGPVARTSAHSVRVAATHAWKASATNGTIHASSRIVLTANYSSGKISVSLTGVKKGDKIHMWVTARKGTAKAVTIDSIHTTVGTSTGKFSFSLALSGAKAMRIRDLVAAGNTLTFHLKDGTVKSLSAPYTKA
jgi:hypothetical protein